MSCFELLDCKIFKNGLRVAYIPRKASKPLRFAKLLLEGGAEINAVPSLDYAGTGLNYAALNGPRAMIEFLLEQGADLTVLGFNESTHHFP